MELQKLNVKFFVEQPDAVALTDFIEIFHSWIQATDGVYHDVADYSHMEAGPGIVLLANDANVSIDESGNRRGLLFSQKAPLTGSNQDKLRQVLRSAMEYCRKLEAEPAMRGRLCFAADEAVLSLNDRLLGEDSPAAFEALQSDVETVAKELFRGATVTVDRDADARRRLRLHIRISPNINDLAQALADLPGKSAVAGAAL